jgi:tetratricopeptide (TPR) repeat protein
MTPTATLHRQLASDYEQRGDGANAAVHRGRALLLQGLAEYRQNRVEEALALVRQSLGCNDRDAQSWFHAGELEYQLGRQDEADAAFARALEIRPGYGRPRQFLNRPRLEK